MQYNLFHIHLSHEIFKETDGYVSFKKFADFLEQKLNESYELKAKFYRFVLKHLRKNPELLAPIPVTQLKNYTLLLDLLQAIILPHLADEKELAMALSAPVSGSFFLSTEAFYNLIRHKPSSSAAAELEEQASTYTMRRNKMKYVLVLERFYNFKPFIKEEMVQLLTDSATQLTRYFSIDIDNRFVEVEKNAALPKININQVFQQLTSDTAPEELEKILPLSGFSFNGFSIVTATDITPRYALHKMRSAIIRHNASDYNATYKTIIELLKQLCGIGDAAFGLLPFLKLNDMLVAYYQNHQHSLIVNICTQLNLPETVFIEWINVYYKNPQTILSTNCMQDEKDNKIYNAFLQLGNTAFALLPVYYNNKVAGLLEITVQDADDLNEQLFLRIDSAAALLGQLMHVSQTEFAADITNVIRTNFTSIQPSVLWKFNEVSWNYIKNSGKNVITNIEEIRFNNVYPLYGAIDIRDSTIKRNDALYKDANHYYIFVKEILNELKVKDSSAIDDLKLEVNILLQHAETYFSSNEESMMDTFADKLNAYLNSVDKSAGYNRNVIKKYFKEANPKNGKAFLHRRVLENSMQFLNAQINNYLEKMYAGVQEQYPVYFEKFRTDGIEYDIYIGQSISPQQPYKQTWLSELRFLQLKDMAAIAKLVQAASSSLPVPLQTTQLIYVNASSIDITFRMDEKKFDVEGSYSIRYHIIKKRIDKVHIKDTNERLTQPDKIAVIYTQPHHEADYLKYIYQLQKQNILKKEIELLELEELQGVTGLKAIRIGVNTD